MRGERRVGKPALFFRNPDNAFIVIANWMRNHSTILFLGLWEQIHNLDFKPIEFDRFKAESGDNAFTLTPQQWIKATNAIGIISKKYLARCVSIHILGEEFPLTKELHSIYRVMNVKTFQPFLDDLEFHFWI